MQALGPRSRYSLNTCDILDAPRHPCPTLGVRLETVKQPGEEPVLRV